MSTTNKTHFFIYRIFFFLVICDILLYVYIYAFFYRFFSILLIDLKARVTILIQIKFCLAKSQTKSSF